MNYRPPFATGRPPWTNPWPMAAAQTAKVVVAVGVAVEAAEAATAFVMTGRLIPRRFRRAVGFPPLRVSMATISVRRCRSALRRRRWPGREASLAAVKAFHHKVSG